jgi:hypothetical protein
VELLSSSEYHKIRLAGGGAEGYDNGLNMSGEEKGVNHVYLKKTVFHFTLHAVFIPLILLV